MSDVEQITGELQQFQIEQNPKKTIELKKNKKYIFNKILKIIFSTPGLVVLVVIYSIMGALIFPLLEAPKQIKTNIATSKSREECLKELWTITEKLNVLYEKNWTMLVHEQLKRFEDSIIVATRNGVNGFESERSTKWTFSEALLYSVTVITTIGHGNLTPKTSGGKMVTIFYALIGVPLMLMCLSNLGSVLAEILEFSYIKLFSSSNKAKSENNKSSQHNEHHQQNQHNSKGNCKYDVISCETKFYNNCEYAAVNQHEDSRHLFQNSPKFNHNSTFMQLKNHHNQQNCIKTNSPLKYNNLNKYNQFQTPYQSPNQSPIHHIPQQHKILQNSPQQCQLRNQSNHFRFQYGQSGQCDGTTVSLGNNDSDGNVSGTTTTVYFPIASTALNNLPTCTSPIHQYEQQPVIKYHTIRLQSRGNFEHHLQTEMNRGKLIPKPIPPEINVLLPKTDVTFNDEQVELTTSNVGQNLNNPNVDIMEDEEENEMNRIKCPHGTPSRIPLIQSTSGKSVVIADIENENSDILCENFNQQTDDSASVNEISTNYVKQVPIFIVLFILCSYIMLGTVVFAFWENWSFIDGAYFCFITLSTIGYTDILPLNTFNGPEVQLFACCAYLLLGLVLVAMSFNILETQLMWKCKRIAVRLKLTKD